MKVLLKFFQGVELTLSKRTKRKALLMIWVVNTGRVSPRIKVKNLKPIQKVEHTVRNLLKKGQVNKIM
jgi:hypothetical protein